MIMHVFVKYFFFNKFMNISALIKIYCVGSRERRTPVLRSMIWSIIGVTLHSCLSVREETSVPGGNPREHHPTVLH